MSKIKSQLLGENFSTAIYKLRKQIMFSFMQRLGLDTCFRCNQKIDFVKDLSIEHKLAWQSAENPAEAFYDLENIAFSHLKCNIVERIPYNSKKTKCKYGHTEGWFKVNNQGSRVCKVCNKLKVRKYREKYGRKKY